MDSENHQVNVYGLVTELCKQFLDKHTPEEHPYLPHKDNTGALKSLRARAFEILLKKSTTKNDDTDYRDVDPILECLKYAFVLKTALGKCSRAEELESSLDCLSENKADIDPSIYSTLQFLICLKTLKPKDDNALDVFHYGRPHPLLPEQLQDPKQVPRYQVYPMDSFVVPERFEAMLGIDRSGLMIENSRDSPSSFSFRSQYRSAATIGIESLRSEDTTGSMFSAPRYTVGLVSTREFSMASHFMSHITEDSDERLNEYSTGYMGSIPRPEPPWLCVKPARQDGETNSEISDAQLTSTALNEKADSVEDLSLAVWDNVTDLGKVLEHRTWLNLGQLNAPKEPPFISEKVEAMLHLERIEQAGFLPLLPRNVVESLDIIKEVPTRELIECVKLLLVGVESEHFTWDENLRAFALRNNTMIPGLSVEALKSACSEVMYWGACYRLLSLLIKPDPHTNKRQQEGLIFQAMCNSVKELLLYYQAVILRISVENDESPTLLKLLRDIRPMGNLIAEVARLCRCDRDNQEVLGEGLGLLSHIYKQVTRITKPSVALVFYSILKSCCEVYFRMLQRWLFEGSCDDDYGEFMIEVRPQFLREQSHRFWTKGFGINNNSVPGFLSHLTDSILECGKTVRLLKICEPKNPLCTMFATSHPAVRVCLSVGMVREQEINCREFYEKGEELLGKNVSFSFAFEEQRIHEKERADLVIAAQLGTLQRLKREHEEAKLESVRNKRELLAQLKDQAEEVASRKLRERAAELLKDKQYLEDINAAEEIAKNAEIAEKKNVVDYYNELAAQAERRRVRTEWRMKRMKLFEQRADSINGAKRELRGIEESETALETKTAIANIEEEEEADKKVEEIVGECEVAVALETCDAKPEDSIGTEDENQNPAESGETWNKEEAIAPGSPAVASLEIVAKPDLVANKKSPRPCVLEINRTRMMSGTVFSNLNEYREALDIDNSNTANLLNRAGDTQQKTDDSKSAAEQNKLKVLQQEYGMTPNNNELNIIVMDAEGNKNTICIDTATVNPDNLRLAAEAATRRNKNHGPRNEIDAWDNEESSKPNYQRGPNLTDAEKNRNRNMHHYTEAFDDFSVSNAIGENARETDAQKNRRRNMTHTYRDAPPEPSGRVNFADYTDLQKNRARVMGHDNRNYQDYALEEIGANCLDPLTPMSLPAADDGMTPMSCTTDTFPLSLSSSFTHEDLLKSGMRSTTTPGDLASEDPLESRPISSSGFDFPRGNQAFPNFFGLEAAATPSFESSLTIADVEMIDNTSLQVYLEKSVAIPLRVQSRLANAAIVKHLLYERKMLSHLHSLRSFFFLLNGEFAKSFTSSLYKRLYEISSPIELFRTATLTNIMKNSLNSSLSSTYDNSELLSLSAMDIPSQLQLSNPEFLNCLCLNYKITWPLNIILDAKVMHQYTKVFKFLVMVGRVLYVLQEDFHILKVERKAATSDQYHKLQLYRHSMMQFITAFHNYLTCSVLHASWAEFEKDLESSTTLDQIHLTHVMYIKKILSRCMLTDRGEKMRTFLCNIFKIILKFHNRVRSQNWSTVDGGYTHANFQRLEQMYRTFCEARTYLAHVANKLASSGYQPHLTHFLNALNINPLYDLTHTDRSKKA